MERKRLRFFAGLLALAVCLAGCAAPPSEAAPPLPTPVRTLSPTPTPAPTPTPTPAPTPTPTPTDRDRAEALLATLTLEEKVGQMFIARCPEGDAAALAAQYQLGGYLLFGRDLRDKTWEEVVAMNDSYRAAATVPLFLAVDEEGGVTSRVGLCPALRSAPFPSPQALYRDGGFEAVAADASEKAQLLHALGLNMNFAPVCDVSQDPEDFIYQRTLGQDADLTAQYVETVVRATAGSGVARVLKHFPGYGTNRDTHAGVAYDQRPWEVSRPPTSSPSRPASTPGRSWCWSPTTSSPAWTPTYPPPCPPRSTPSCGRRWALRGSSSPTIW